MNELKYEPVCLRAYENIHKDIETPSEAKVLMVDLCLVYRVIYR